MVKLQLNVKRAQIPAFYGMADLQIRDKVRSIIKTQIEKSFFCGGEEGGKGCEEFSKALPVNTSSWEGAYVSLSYCHYIVPALY